MTAYTVYIFSKCTSCQKAIRFLEQHGVSFEIKDIVQTPPSIEMLERMLGYVDGNLRKLFNTSGQLYRESKLSERLADLSISDAFSQLSQKGMLVKRPFLIGNETGATGFCETQWQRFIPNTTDD